MDGSDIMFSVDVLIYYLYKQLWGKVKFYPDRECEKFM